MLKKIIILESIVAFIMTTGICSAESQAGLFVEPALTYELGSTSVNYPSPFSSSDGDANGFGIGARLGFHLEEIFFLALDARFSKTTYKDTGVGYSASGVSSNWGPVIGIQTPLTALEHGHLI
jgi:hypothetical protein